MRDLTWSRHQLEELAERRFVAAQRATASRASPGGGDRGPDGWGDAPGDLGASTSFIDLFKKVCVSGLPEGCRAGKPSCLTCSRRCAQTTALHGSGPASQKLSRVQPCQNCSVQETGCICAFKKL